jgi:DeoR/GlpR family transcriptional regulator of sugar metabolism
MKIAAAAAVLVRDGETLFINSGTTAYYTALELKRRKNLNIVTNSIPIALELADYPSFRVTLLGGSINAQYSFTFGSNALEQLRQYRAQKTILSMDGIDVEAGLTTYHAEEATLNRIMMDRSDDTIVVAEGSKLGRESFSFVAVVSPVSLLVTDVYPAGNPSLEKLQTAGLRIITAE